MYVYIYIYMSACMISPSSGMMKDEERSQYQRKNQFLIKKHEYHLSQVFVLAAPPMHAIAIAIAIGEGKGLTFNLI